MTGLTNASVAQQVQDLLDKTKQQTQNLSAWLGGSTDGGPNNDGRYPFVDVAGREILVPSPAKLSDMVGGPAALADVAKVSAELARDIAISAADRAETHSGLADAARGAAIDARNLAQEHRNHAGTHESNARYWAELAQAKGAESDADRAVVEQLAGEVADNAAAASQDAQDAAASAALAATFNPALYDLKSDTLDAARLVNMIDPARIPVLVGQVPVVSSGGIADLTAPQQTGIAAGTLISTMDGRRWVYKGAGSKTDTNSYIEQGDVTPDWSVIANKPLYFASTIAHVSGLQAALDGKSTNGHGHVIADTAGLQAALDAKVAWNTFPTLTQIRTHYGADAGTIYFGAGDKYLNYDGSNFSLVGGNLYAGGAIFSNGHRVWSPENFDPATKAGTTGSGASGTWGISVTGTAARVSSAGSYVHTTSQKSDTFGGLSLSFVSEGQGWPSYGTLVTAQGYPGGGGTLQLYVPYSPGLGGSALRYRIAEYSGVDPAPWGPMKTIWDTGNFDPTTKAAALHSHDWSQVTGKPTLLSYLGSTASGSMDSAPTNGFQLIGYPDHARAMFSFNAGGSTGDVQQEFKYLTHAGGYWRVRNKLDGTAWQPWRHVVLHDDPIAPLTGTVWTSTNLTVDVNRTANAAVRRDGSGYIQTNWIHSTDETGIFTSSGRYFYNSSGGWLARSGTNNAARLALQNLAGTVLASFYADNAYTVGFLNNADAWTLQIPKAGTPSVRVDDVLRSIHHSGGNDYYDNARYGPVGAYDPTNTQLVWGMGASYTLPYGGASNNYGNFYGLGWSYEPDYGGAGNNPQSKAGLSHQLLIQHYGTTMTAIGTGIWTNGYIESAGSGGWTIGSKSGRNRIDHDGSKFRLLNSLNQNASLETHSVTAVSSITANTFYTPSWYRSTGTTGWYNESYGGGIYMEDATYVRTYNGRAMRSDAGFYVGSTRVPVTTYSQSAPSGGTDGDVHIVW